MHRSRDSTPQHTRCRARARAPLLVIQGANDPRVVKAESDPMVERLRQRGLEVDHRVDENGGHGPADRDGSIDWMERTATFLEERLLPGWAPVRPMVHRASPEGTRLP